MNLKYKLGIFKILVFMTASAQNPSDRVILDSVQKLDEVIISVNTILGSKFAAQKRTGASYYLSSDDLERFGYADINRALRVVPGANFYEEDDWLTWNIADYTK